MWALLTPPRAGLWGASPWWRQWRRAFWRTRLQQTSYHRRWEWRTGSVWHRLLERTSYLDNVPHLLVFPYCYKPRSVTCSHTDLLPTVWQPSPRYVWWQRRICYLVWCVTWMAILVVTVYPKHHELLHGGSSRHVTSTMSQSRKCYIVCTLLLRLALHNTMSQPKKCYSLMWTVCTLLLRLVLSQT